MQRIFRVKFQDSFVRKQALLEQKIFKAMGRRWNVLLIIFAILTEKVFCDNIPKVSTSFFGIKDDRNLGHSGYVYLSTDEEIPDLELSNCQSLNVNVSTCDFPKKVLRSKSTLMAMRAWTAVTMRDNILGVLGYLLHQRNVVFPEDMYSSLRVVYDEVLKNNIRTMNILRRLRTIGKATQAAQIMEVFRILKSVMPVYCTSAIDEILRVFWREQNSLKDILNNKESGRGIDIFTDIESQLAPFLRVRIQKQSFDKSLARRMGKEFSIFYSAILQNRIDLTQPIIAAVMLNTRFDGLSPQDHEDFRFLADVLRNNKILNWSPNLTDASTVKSPSALVQTMIEAIANHSEADPLVKAFAEKLSRKIRNHPQKVFKSHHSNLMDPFFGEAELNTSLLLKVLGDEAKIPEVQTLKKIIYNGALNLSYALKGFVRYFYNTPRALASGFIKRIQNRIPMNNEMKNVVSKIVLSLRDGEMDDIAEDKAPSNGTKRKRNAVEEVIVKESKPLFLNDTDGLYFPIVLPECSHKNNCLSDILREFSPSLNIGSFFKTKSECPEMPLEESLSSWLENLNTPSTTTNISSLLNNVSTILTNFINNNEMKYLIDDIMNCTASENPNKFINHERFRDKDIEISESLMESDKGIIESKVNSKNLTLVETNKDLLVRILRDMLSIKKVRARIYVYYEIIRVYCILIYGSIEYTTKTFSDTLHLDDSTFSNITEIFSDNVSERLKNIIQDFASNQTESSVNPNEYKTNRSYLIDLLKRLLLLDVVRKDGVLFNEAILLLRCIQELSIDMSELLNTEYTAVSNYLKTPGIVKQLSEDIDLGSYRMRGQLGKAMLEKLLLTFPVKRDEALRDDINELIASITCTGKEAQPIREILEGTTDRVNIDKIVQYGFDKQKLTSNLTEVFHGFWGMYHRPAEPVHKFEKFNLAAYDTRADFLTGFLNYAENEFDNLFRTAQQQIDSMKSAVLKTGTGVEPVDYL